MKFKLDENLGKRGRSVLRAAGHDVATVREQGLTSTPDRRILAVCLAEKRALVSLDSDFANTILYPPSRFSGIVVLSFDGNPTRAELEAAFQVLVQALTIETLEGRLWLIKEEQVLVRGKADA